MSFYSRDKSRQKAKYFLVTVGLLLIGSAESAIAQQGGGRGGGPAGLGGEFSIDFTAAAPNTYSHKTGGGAFNDGSAGKDNDVVESLEGGDFSCQDTVTYLAEIVVGSVPGSHTIQLDLDFLADTTGQPGVGHDQITNVAINYGQVENGDSGSGNNPGVGNSGTDSGINDDGGSTATLVDQTVSNPPPLEGNSSKLTGQIQVDDLEAGETVVLRIDTSLSCAPDTSPTGNLQGSIADAIVVDDGSAISAGLQTIPFKQIGNISGAGEPLLEFQKTVTTDLTGSDTVGSEQISAIQGDTVRYLYKVSNLGTGSLYDLQITDDNGTPEDASDDFTVDPTNILSGNGNLNDLGGDAATPDLNSVSEVILYADVPLTNAGTISNSATATGESGSGGNSTTLSTEDTAQVVVDAASQAGTDYGDAPNTYRDASHNFTGSPNLYLGNVAPDSEANTQLTSGESKGDDDDGNDDEDAFIVLPNVPLADPNVTALSLGRNYSLEVPLTNTTGEQATLHAWIDFNQNGKFEAGEYQSATVDNGATSANLTWNTANILGLDAIGGSLATLAGDTHARFRLTTDDSLTDLTGLADIAGLGIDDRSIGNATDGEVEDYPVSIAVPLFDYGDAPDTDTGTGTGNYKTTESDEGPTHIAINDPLNLLHLSLGNTVDGDAGDLQNPEANADDVDTKNVDLLGTLLSGGDTGLDDEDGITSFPSLPATPGQTYTVPVTVRNNIPLLNAYLVGYIDFNQDGDFEDPGEKSATVTVPSDLLEITSNSVSLDTTGAPRTFNVEFTVPNNVTPGNTYARFRLGSIQEIVESATTVTVSTAQGEVNNGEVEDYGISISPGIPAPTIDLDGDDSSATTNNGSNTLYVLGGSAVTLVEDNADESRDTVITTPNGTRLSRMVVTFINIPPIAGDEITIDAAALNTVSSGTITADVSAANRITLNGNADADSADFEAALELIEFTTSSTSTDESDRVITVQIFDNDPQTNAAPVKVNIDVLEIPAVECEYCTGNQRRFFQSEA